MLFLLIVLTSCKTNNDTIKTEELSAWCILDFDALNRTPHERIDMLKQLGINYYGYNRGKGNLDNMQEEFRLAKDNGIEINAVFLWLNAKRDSIGKLSASNQELLGKLKDVDYKPAIWLSFSNNFFEDLSQQQSVDYAIRMIEYIKAITDALGCELALYNHHGWFGNPHNQVAVLKQMDKPSISMVFNFHHTHEYVDEFPEVVKKIKPYLSFVNISGVKKDGPKILPLGVGDHEYTMIKQLVDAGYNGPWGILGHVKTEDVQKVLEQNLTGLKQINTRLKQEAHKTNQQCSTN